MKTNLLFLFAFIVFVSCSDDDNGFPRKADIIIKINASDNSRQSNVETIIHGINLDLRTNSSGNNHLPYTRTYINQHIPDLTNINVSYRDNSVVPFGGTFVPYTVAIEIEIDGDIAVSEEHTITTQGDGPSVNIFLNDYFSK